MGSKGSCCTISNLLYKKCNVISLMEYFMWAGARVAPAHMYGLYFFLPLSSPLSSSFGGFCDGGGVDRVAGVQPQA